MHLPAFVYHKMLFWNNHHQSQKIEMQFKSFWEQKNQQQMSKQDSQIGKAFPVMNLSFNNYII